MKPNFKSGAFVGIRYSNDEATATATTTTTGSGWGGIQWGPILESFINTTGSTLSSIFGKSDKWQNLATQQMLEEERRTNTILWVVIGLVVALAVFLLVRKQ